MAAKLEEFDEKTLPPNPFVYSLEIPVTKMYSKDKFVFLPAEIEGETGTFIQSAFYTERTQSARLYYCTGCIDRVYNLSDKALRMFMYILYHLKRGKDYIQINKDDYMRKNNIKSRTTVLSAIEELLRYSFISSTKYNTVFYTNPWLFSSGDRVSKYPDKLIEQGEL